MSPQATFSINSSVDDQTVEVTGTSYPPSSLSRATSAVILWTYRGFVTPNYFVDNLLLSFDTSSLGVASTVTAATLRMYIEGRANADSLQLQLEYYNWDGSSASDFSNTPGNNAHAGTALSAFTLLAMNDIALTNINNISTTGLTKLRGHISQRASDAAPTGENYLSWGAYDHTTYPEPRLIVTYTLPNDYYLPYESPRDGKKKRTSTFAI